MIHLPKHMSFSALSRYEECPRSWYLSYAKKAEPKQTWFFPMGTAVHSSIEIYIETGDVPEFEDIFYPLVAKQMKIDPVDVNWLSAGSLDNPTIRGKATELGKRCVENAVAFLEDIDVWEVEYDATGTLPGCEVPVKAFIDIVGEHKKHGPVIVDWKSGKSKPKNNLQLETYAVLLNNPRRFIERNSPEFDIGLWAMLNPDASKARPVKGLGQVDVSALGARYQAAYDGMKGKLYKAVPGYGCKWCIMAPNCLFEAGPTNRAKHYDKSAEEGFPF